MADGFSVGVSSFGDLRGVEQFVASADVAAQVRSLCHEFNTQVAKDGDRLTVNEGIRSRARQDALYQAWKTYQKYGRPYASLAANPYTSTHDHTRGSALDFGITRADGSNRALTQAEFDWVHTNGVRRGIRWTGGSFRPVEQWHHNGGYPATVPPIADAPVIDNTTNPKGIDMSVLSVIATVPSNIWYVGSPGKFDAIPTGQGDLHVKLAGQTRPIVFADSELGTIRDLFLHMNPVQVYAVTDGPNRDQWFVVGPGVYFPIPGGKGGTYEAKYGSRHAVSGADFEAIRNVNKIGA